MAIKSKVKSLFPQDKTTNNKPSPQTPQKVNVGTLGKTVTATAKNAKSATASTPYEDAYNKGKKMYEDNAAEQRKYLEDSYKKQVEGINENYDRTANQTYVQYRQNQKALPEQLSNIGMTGGATESANLKLQAAYGTNLADNEFNRNNDLTEAGTSYNDSVNQVNATLNQTLADAYNSALQQDTAYTLEQKEIKRQEEKAAAEKREAEAKEAKEKAEAEAKEKEVVDWNAKVNSMIAAAQRQGYEVYTWTDADGKIHYRKLNKTNAEATKLDKINNERQREAAKLQAQGYEVYTWTDERGYFHYQKGKKASEESTATRSGSGGGSSGGSSGDDESTGSGDPSGYKRNSEEYKSVWDAYYDVADSENKNKNRYNVLSTNLANAMLKDSSEAVAEYYYDIIEEAYKNKELTKEQYNKLMKSIGAA